MSTAARLGGRIASMRSRQGFTGPQAPAQLATLKMGAMQHGIQRSGIDGDDDRTILALYDMVMLGIAKGAQTGVADFLADLKSRNSKLMISQYMHCVELRCRGIYSITKVSGTTYRVTLDGTPEYSGNSSNVNLANGTSVYIRNAGAFNGTYSISNVGSSGGRGFCDITVASTPADMLHPCRGTFTEVNHDHTPLWLLVTAQDWWVRDSIGKLIPSVGGGTFAINFLDWANVDTNGDRWPQARAKWDKPNLMDGMIPTGGQLDFVFIDNWNYRPRFDDGCWNLANPTTPIARTDATLQTKWREGLKAYAEALRAQYPGIKIMGNADGVPDAGNPKSIDWPEWPSQTLDSVFWENVYDSPTASVGMWTDDAGGKVINRYKEHRTRSQGKYHVFQTRGQGATNAIQQADSKTFAVGMATYLMLGTSQDDLGFYCFGPKTHDVRPDWVAHDEMFVPIGEPIEGEQLAPRGITGNGQLYMRYFEGGVALWNPSASLNQTVNPANPAGSTAPHPPGTTYKRINGTTNPENTGADVTSTITLAPKTGIFLQRKQ